MCTNKNQLGLAFGGTLAIVHAVWSVIIALGYGQSLLDWIFGLHMISSGFAVMPFSFGRAITLVIFTFVVGYVIGWLLAAIWNWAGTACMGKKRRR